MKRIINWLLDKQPQKEVQRHIGWEEHAKAYDMAHARMRGEANAKV